MPIMQVRNRLAYIGSLPLVSNTGAVAAGGNVVLFAAAVDTIRILHSIILRVTNAGRFTLETNLGIPLSEYFMVANQSYQFDFAQGGQGTPENQDIRIVNNSPAVSDISVTVYYEVLKQ